MERDLPWFKTAVIYELHVRSFCDSTADGVGDFRGLCKRLGYLEDLGITAIWLLPFYPSPLKDDGYDISDYLSVNPSYGTLDDFRNFLAEAHQRRLHVITELVLNHTSDQHPWFQRSRLALPGSVERDFYVWSDTTECYEDARVIFSDFEKSNWSWDSVAQAYYWHRFYSHQPDLNFDNPSVQEAVFNVVNFWLGLGVDGLRLDAVPYLFEREGTSCENLPETHAFLRRLRRHVDEKFPGRLLLAEANQWPEDAAAYFGAGDECHMEFHFPLMPRLFMALQMEDRFPLTDIFDQTPTIPENCQWAIFLRNHDELTLEMVSDEERDYMVRLYAEDIRARINLGIRRRLAPLLGNNRRKIELMKSLLLSLPGTPILYYGDEIGMGDNFYLGDRNGVRTPMQWSADRNAGFSRANPQQLFLPIIIDPEFHYETVNVDVQKRNLSSLFWWMRRILGIRQKHLAFALGGIQFLSTENSKVLAYLRRYGEDQVLLIVANLSRYSQAVSLDLSEFHDRFPEELFGNTRFPIISNLPYLFTLGPHGFYWLQLHPLSVEEERVLTDHHVPPLLAEVAEWTPKLHRTLERAVLPDYMQRCRWFGEKQLALQKVRITGSFSPKEDPNTQILLTEVAFTQGHTAIYVVPLTIRNQAGDDSTPPAHSIVACFASGEMLLDALYVQEVHRHFLNLVAQKQTWHCGTSQLFGIGEDILPEPTTSRLCGSEQSNSSLVFNEQFNLKLLRRYESGSNPDVDLLRALGKVGFAHVPRYCGEIRYMSGSQQGTVALLTAYVPNQGDAWTHTLDSLGRFFEGALAAPPLEEGSKILPELMAGYPERAYQLGLRTGELHRCLATLPGAAFTPELFTSLYQRSLYQTLRSLARRTELDLASKIPYLPESLQVRARSWIAATPRLLAFYARLLRAKIPAKKIRSHGDYHLGQVLNTGRDFVILDFEGEPCRPFGERLLKRPALVDVAGMLRSFDYAAQSALLAIERQEDHIRLSPWYDLWKSHITSAFLDGYLTGAAKADFLPQTEKDFTFLLKVFLLDKALYEIRYELSYRPALLGIPLCSAHQMLQVVDEWGGDITEAFNRSTTTIH
ncbi:MAG: maltose alpha-D-glucosyltransferase [Candidatus Xiphinematobacter sp.]|nr:MAG: maltose alpha-D-glucosyltransferase [Candidatus Xiphinematobacter sp.]